MSVSDRKAAFQIAKDTYFEHLCSKLSELGFKRQGKKRIVRRVEQGKQGITVFQEKYRGCDSGYILFTAFFDFPKVNTIAAYIEIVQSVVRPAFEMAVDDDLIRKNPFKFKMSDILPNDANVRYALTKDQQRMFLDFLMEYGKGNYYDDVVVLLGTGLRVSELYGLTINDIFLEQRYLEVTHQLCRTASKPYFITPPKTKSGIRKIPLTDEVCQAFRRVIQSRNPIRGEFMIDGYTGFLFLDQYGMPKVAMHLENYLRNIQKRHEEESRMAFPHVTPHVLRHTFCTNAQKAGLDVKSLQYLMGHSHASVTLDVYTHSDYSSVEKAFGNIAVNL